MANQVSIRLDPGTYFVGINRPWYASRGAVRSRLESVGFRNVRFYDRESTPPVNPRLDSHYQDGWDEWLRADYSGAIETKKVERVWQWWVRIPRAVAEKTPAIANPEPETASKKTGGVALLAVAPVAVAGWIWSRTRRR